jgi:acetyl esterase
MAIPIPSPDVADIVFARVREVELGLDVYLPEASTPVPAVILIHGGYWQSGDKQSHARLANRMMLWGCAAFAINYRLAPDFPFPAAVEDVQCAVAWVREHAAEYSVDPDRIALLSTSAGGHLAALAGVAGGRTAPPAPWRTRVCE